MGCWSSKAEECKLVSLCRERLELIRAARNRRYALASAHSAYFRALIAVGEALHRFVEEELAPASPFIVLPSPEGKEKPESGIGAAAVASTSSSATPLSHSLSMESSHLPLSSVSETEAVPQGRAGSEADGRAGSNGGGDKEEDSSPYQRLSQYSPNSSLIRSSTAIPTIVYQDPFPPPSSSEYNGYGYGFTYPPYGVPITSESQAREEFMGPSIPDVARGTPPAPSPPEASSWDFFNPFNSYEFLPHYPGGKYGVTSVSISDLNEVRKQEGIPDLEVEEVVGLTREPKKKEVVDVDLVGKNPIIGSCNGVSTREIGEKDDKVGDILLAEKESRIISADHQSSATSASRKVQSIEEDEISNGKKKGVTFEDISYVTEESGPSSGKQLSADSAYSDEKPLLVEDMKDVMEVVQEIEELFRSAAVCGEDLSRMLEVGKVPYRSPSRMYRVFSSRILGHMDLPLRIKSLASLSQYLTKNTKRRKASNAGAENHPTARSGNLSSTLEKLYVCEKKLYKEVKDEQKLQIKYDKKYRWLRTLDDRGAENSKIDLAWTSVRKLRTRINVIIKSVDAISRRMHKIRDEELQPQLTELIKGFTKMWKSMLDCHQKQLQTLLLFKNHKLVVKTNSQKKYVAKATKKLELELLNWCNCFNDWINVQKSYIVALSGWLTKWLPQEQEQTINGIAPFSPAKIGAPSTFIICNDWYHAINKISAEKVIIRLHAFTEIIHITWESQDEECHQRLEQQRLIHSYDRKLKSVQASKQNEYLEIPSGHEDNLLHHDDDSSMALEPLKKRLDKKRSTHMETLQRLQDVASSIFPTGLVPLFEELGTFTSEALQVYNGIRTSK
ncbi:hypothetical protein Cni_G20683 [Canna indica]|uniref:Nitrate regulatory gene2 protein n=1 Tax=Canna indica TaxID=4628 RepID=A0AAQ3KNK6_9LILI|nr:hypothetical protein Cni_G20683 [Canna indica]